MKPLDMRRTKTPAPIDPVAMLPQKCLKCEKTFECPHALLMVLDALEVLRMLGTTLN